MMISKMGRLEAGGYGIVRHIGTQQIQCHRQCNMAHAPFGVLSIHFLASPSQIYLCGGILWQLCGI